MSSGNRKDDGRRTKRRYDSTSRRARSRATQTRVIEAAGELFVDRGFAGTSIREIAERAGVSQETVYGAFGSKAALLMRWVDVQVAGDEEPVPVIERPWVDEMRSEPSRERRLALLVEHGTTITSRAASAMAVLRAASAADPQLAELLAVGQQNRREDTAVMFDLLIGANGQRGGLDRDKAIDWLWAVTSDELYNALVSDRGWRVAEYREWLHRLIRATLVED